MIVAVSDDYGIGFQGRLPWNVPHDLKFFGSVTSFGGPRNTLIMGRKTFESIDYNKLSKSRNIIVISSTLKSAPNYQVYTTFDEALDSVKTGKVWVIGGKKVYEEAMYHDNLDLIVVSRIPGTYESDTYLYLEYEQQNWLKRNCDFIQDYSDQFKVEVWRNVWQK
jgi:dihydrofolate reductase